MFPARTFLHVDALFCRLTPKPGPQWQLEEPHPLLVEHASRLLPPRAAAHRVLVPLCGKDVSLTYLAKYGRGALPSPRKEGATTEGGGAAVGTEVTTAAGARVGQVVGVEGAAQAIREFAAEHPAFGVPAPLQDSKGAPTPEERTFYSPASHLPPAASSA